MERIDKILNHDLFNMYLAKNNAAEAERRFCRHGIEHFLDVARIGCIINLEEKLNLDKEIIYGAALLHDIGKHVQYETGLEHELASSELAPEILKDCGFDDNETGVIISAIRNHRNSAIQDNKDLQGVLYRADKASRACFACLVGEECNWKGTKKNMRIKY